MASVVLLVSASREKLASYAANPNAHGVDPDDSVEIVTRLRKLNAERAAEEAAQAAEAGKRRKTR